jgi:hypothetical protein
MSRTAEKIARLREKLALRDITVRIIIDDKVVGSISVVDLAPAAQAYVMRRLRAEAGAGPTIPTRPGRGQALADLVAS